MRHGTRIAAIWFVASAIVEVLIAIIPIPAPTGSREGLGEHQTVYMLFYVGAPIFVFIWVLFLYNVVVFRRRSDNEIEHPAPPDSTPILLIWAGLSFTIVLFLAGWGTFTLKEITDAPTVSVAVAQTTKSGAKSAVSVHAVKPLQVQVIGQEWLWTFRYPSYGGMETRDLVLPVNTPISLNITSLDVVHSFWIYDYDVKEDAVPGISNHAWLLPRTTSSFTYSGRDWVKCNELCGLWHGYMRSKLYVKSTTAFTSWATGQEQSEKTSGLLANLPKYADVYFPTSNANWPTAPQDQSP
jgi:cytochrome c oxidase subunit 2